MKVKELVEYLSRINPEAEVIIHRDVDNYGFGLLDKIQVGLFSETDYGNDFYLDQRLVVNPKEVKAVCFVAQDDNSDTQRKKQIKEEFDV